MKRAFLLITAFSLLLVSAGSRVQRAQTDERLREEFHQTYPLTANGRFALSNIAGNIRVVAGERNEVKVDAIKLAYSQERLAEARIEAENTADTVRLKTKYPERRNMYFSDGRSNDAEHRKMSAATVEFTVTVPRGASCEINSVSGDIDIEGVAGSLKIGSVSGDAQAKNLSGQSISLSSVSGRAEAAVSKTSDGQSISLSSVSGSVILALASDANADVRANAVSGRVINSFGLPVRVGQYVGRDFAGQIGAGGAKIKLSTVSGAVELHRLADGKPLSRVTSTLPESSDAAGRDWEDARADVEDARREYENALREAEQGLKEAEKEFARMRAEYDKAQKEGDEEARRDSRQEFEEARREFEQARREFQNVQREQQRELQRAQREAQREGVRAQVEAAREQAAAAREAARESARSSAEASRTAADIMRGVNNDLYIGKNGPMLTERDERTLKINGASNFNLYTDDGGIIVHAWDNPEVKVVFVKRGQDQAALSEFKLTAQQSGSNIEIRADVEKKTYSDKARGWYYNGSVSLEVWLPRSVKKLNVHTGDGRIMLEGVNGELDLHTGDGSVDVLRGGGTLKIVTGDGRVSVNQYQGAAAVKTGDGRISLNGDFTALEADTGDGNITYTYANAPNAVIEAECESIVSNGSFGPMDDSRSRKRLTLGNGGKTFRFRTGDGKLYLQKEN